MTTDNPNEGQGEMTTRPTIETVLERINAMDQKLSQKIDALDDKLSKRIDGLESEVGQLRKDINKGFRRMERKIDILNRDFLSSRTDFEELVERVEALESKVS